MPLMRVLELLDVCRPGDLPLAIGRSSKKSDAPGVPASGGHRFILRIDHSPRPSRAPPHNSGAPRPNFGGNSDFTPGDQSGQLACGFRLDCQMSGVIREIGLISPIPRDLGAPSSIKDIFGNVRACLARSLRSGIHPSPPGCRRVEVCQPSQTWNREGRRLQTRRFETGNPARGCTHIYMAATELRGRTSPTIAKAGKPSLSGFSPQVRIAGPQLIFGKVARECATANPDQTSKAIYVPGDSISVPVQFTRAVERKFHPRASGDRPGIGGSGRCLAAGSLCLGVLLHALEKGNCGSGILTDPTVVYLFDGNGVQAVPSQATLAADDHDSGSFQHAQMLHHRAAIQAVQPVTNFTRRELTVLQQIENSPPRPIGERFEYQIFA